MATKAYCGFTAQVIEESKDHAKLLVWGTGAAVAEKESEILSCIEEMFDSAIEKDHWIHWTHYWKEID